MTTGTVNGKRAQWCPLCGKALALGRAPYERHLASEHSPELRRESTAAAWPKLLGPVGLG